MFTPMNSSEAWSSAFIPFWTQMTRLNETHFHNETSIFNQNLIFNMPEFSAHVISNEHGKLRLASNSSE